MLRTVRILINFFRYPHNPSHNLMYSLGCYMNTAVTDLDALYRPCKEKNHTLTHVTPRNFLDGPVRRRAFAHYAMPAEPSFRVASRSQST